MRLEADVSSAGEHQGSERASGDRESLDQLHPVPPFLAPTSGHIVRPGRCPQPGDIWPSLSGVPHQADKGQYELHHSYYEAV